MRALLFLLPVGSLFALLFSEVLLQDRTFIYRDAGHFYYPYFKMIQQQWESGRIPLWNPYENGGEPLVGNPTSSVFYPLKILFFLLPYSAAYKWYLLLHVLLAWGTCFIAGRDWGLRRIAASISATAYAFSGPLIFQLYNIVFLCGAAWLPFGLLAADRLVRSPSFGRAVALAVVLALQVLAGDPQIAFLIGLCTVGYAFFFYGGPRAGLALSLATLAVGYPVVQIRRWLPDLMLARLAKGGLADAIGQHTLLAATIVALPLAGLVVLAVTGRRIWQGDARRCVCLALVGGAIGFLLCAIQVLPTMDLVGVSDRAAPKAPHESAAFSFFPARLVEILVPGVYGRQFPISSRWAPFQPLEVGIWNPTVYMGLFPILLAVIGWKASRLSASWSFLGWLSVLMLFAAFGKFGGPQWLWNSSDPSRMIGGRERDEKLYGDTDGVYRIFEETIPGFRSFRYPAKLMIFVVLGVSLLAGLGWDRFADAPKRWLGAGAFWLAGLGLGLTVVLAAARTPFVEFVKDLDLQPSGFGPVNVELAWRHAVRAAAHLAVASLTLAVVVRQRVSARWSAQRAGYALLALLCLDLYVAQRWLIITDEQSVVDAKPLLARVIDEDHARDAQGELVPFRVHRTRIFEPPRWHSTSAGDRDVEMARWERDTLQPKYGLPWDVHYTMTVGTMSIYDVQFFFAPWTVPTPPSLKRTNPHLPNELTYFPRSGFDLWNTKYFILPAGHVFDHEERGVITLLRTRYGEKLPELAESPPDKDDYLVLKNPEAFPRAWIVHAAQFQEPIKGLRRQDRAIPMEQMLYRSLDGGVPMWKGRRYGDYPADSKAMIEYEPADGLWPFVSNEPSGNNDRVTFVAYEPDCVRMNVNLQTPGFVILADTYHSGWSATVDGKPAPLARANRAMRAVPVPAGEHVVEMTYHSTPFMIGAILSGVSWLGVLAFSAHAFWRRVRRGVFSEL